MATEPATETTTATATKLKLDPPDALQAVPPAEAAGLVPLKTEETSELDKRVSQFVDELAALDTNSPEFGKKVDQLTTMGRKEIAEAAGASNRFLDRPVKSIDKDSGIGANLTQLRKTVEDLDPGRGGALSKPRKLFGLIPLGNTLYSALVHHTVTPIELDSIRAKRLRQEIPEALYESGKSQLSLRVPEDPVKRFPAVVRAADVLLAVTREAA